MTVTQYIEMLEVFFNRHKQIKTTKSGNQFKFNANDKQIYSVAHIEYINTSTLSTSKTFNFLITIADLYDANIDNEEQIFSDSDQIATDTLDYFSNIIDPPFNDVDQSIFTTKFTNGHTDDLRGCTFIISFSEWRDAKDCIIPLKPL